MPRQDETTNNTKVLVAAAISHKPEPLHPIQTVFVASALAAVLCLLTEQCVVLVLIRPVWYGESQTSAAGGRRRIKLEKQKCAPTLRFNPLADSSDVPLASVLSPSHVTHFYVAPRDPVLYNSRRSLQKFMYNMAQT